MGLLGAYAEGLHAKADQRGNLHEERPFPPIHPDHHPPSLPPTLSAVRHARADPVRPWQKHRALELLLICAPLAFP